MTTQPSKNSKDHSRDFDSEVVVIEREKVQPIHKTWPPDDHKHFQCHRMGSAEEANLQVVIEEQAWQDAFDHAAKNQHLEIGGMLLGSYCKDQDNEFVLIQQTLRAELNESYRGALVFTVQALIELDQKRERMFPELRVVGWYHSHPGFGIFYSSIDAGSHQTQFTQPFHVGMVIDPIKKDAGFFVWQDARLTGPHGFWIVKPLTSQSEVRDNKRRLVHLRRLVYELAVTARNLIKPKYEKTIRR